MPKKSYNKIIAVTGATGFVGQHLVHALTLKGYCVKALTRRPQASIPGVEWIEGDFDNTAALKKLLEGCSSVFHLAGAVKAKNFSEFSEVNARSVKILLDIIDHINFRPHFILLSSLAAREPHLSDYARSKRDGENHLTSHSGEFPWTIIRPPGIYGPGDMETRKIFQAVSYGFAPIPGSRANRASWIYVHDLVEGLCELMSNENTYEKILDMDDGKDQGYSIEELYDIAADVMGRTIVKIILPKFVLNIIAHLNLVLSKVFGYKPMLSPKKVNELYYPDWICHGQHAMTCSNWRPEKQLKQGLKETFKWYKKNNLL